MFALRPGQSRPEIKDFSVVKDKYISTFNHICSYENDSGSAQICYSLWGLLYPD